MNEFQTTIEQIQTALNVSEATSLDELRVLADEYATACLEVGRRLSECSKFLRVGNLPEALRLAETPPRVLDSCNLLDFPERDDWEAVCKSYRLTVPTKPNAAIVERLNRAFEEVAPLAELLRKNRRAALKRISLKKRLEILYRLANLNPTNLIWSESIAELAPFRDREIAAEIDEIDAASGADRAEKRARMKLLYRELTDSRRQTEAPSATLERVKKFLVDDSRRHFLDQFSALEKSLESALASGDVAVGKRLLSDWNAAVVSFRVLPDAVPSSARAAKNRLETFVRCAEAAGKRERRFQAATTRWKENLETVEDVEQLEEIWTKIIEAAQGRKIPDELVGRRDELFAFFQARQKKSASIRIALTFGVVALALLAATAVVLALVR